MSSQIDSVLESPCIPEITDEELHRLSGKVRPAEVRGYILRHIEVSDLRRPCGAMEKSVGKLRRLVVLDYVCTYHASKSLYSVAEVFAQIPDKYRDVATAFRVIPRRAFFGGSGVGPYRATTILYRNF